MGLLACILGRRSSRHRGVLAKEDDSEEKNPRPRQPPPTPGTRVPRRPPPTPTTRPLGNPRGTAGTQTYGAPAGTPSTQRIHNPSHLGR